MQSYVTRRIVTDAPIWLYCATVLTLLGSASSSSAQDVEATLHMSLDKIEQEIDGVSATLQKVVKGKPRYRRDLSKPTLDEKSGLYWFQSRRQRSDFIKEKQRVLVDLRRKRWDKDVPLFIERKDVAEDLAVGTLFQPFHRSLAVMSSGRVAQGVFAGESDYAVYGRVIQVLPENSVLLNVYLPVPARDLGNAIVENVSQEHLLDDARFQLPTLVYLGTKTYESRTGSRTVKSYRIADVENLQRQLDQALASHMLGEAKNRIWTDSTGKFKVEAGLVDFENGVVKLKKLDGNQIELPVDKLSADGRAFVERTLGDKPK